MNGLSYFDYRASEALVRDDPPFYALIAAAMRRADTLNVELLRGAFPLVWRDLYARYHAPGGLLDTDSPELKERVLSGSLEQ